MFRRIGLAVSPVFLLLTDCSTEAPAETDVAAVISRNTQSNTEIFAEEGTAGETNIVRYVCKKDVIERLLPTESLDDSKIVKAKCAADRPVTRAAFEAAWKTAYLASENFRILGLRNGTGELNEQEAAALARLAGDLGWSAAEAEVRAQEAPAIENAKAVFLNTMDAAYDAALRVSLPEEGPTGATVMAGAVRVELGAMKMPDSKVSKATTFRVAAESAKPVDYVQLTLTPARCTTIKSVVGVAADGTTTITTNRTTRSGHRFALQKRNAGLASVAITAVKLKSSTESGRSCNIKITGGALEQTGPRATPEERDRTMRTFMGQRNHRIWHYLWHGVRGSWPRMSARQRERVATALGQEWARPQEATQSFGPNRGEEFLHMHRAMLGMLKDVLGPDMYEPWASIPSEDDPNFPVATENRDPETYALLTQWDTQAKDATFLRSKSLAEYGAWLEENLHNNLHMYWSDPSTGDKFGPLEPQSLFQQGSADADTIENDYLGSTYASHVNPIFYRIHGYVNARVESWLQANGYTSISDSASCAAPACYKWKGVWDGPLPHRVESDTSVATSVGPTPSRDQVQSVATDPGLARLLHNNSNMNPVDAAKP